jgi:two-component system chemotaxis response regulator CheB
MRKARILIVDDAVIVRRVLTDVLSAEPGLEVVGSASNGRLALAKIPHLNPDLITLDMEMPEMDGIQTLREIRKLYPKLPVIMFSSLTARGATATLDALAEGANDYVAKPANSPSNMAAIESIRTGLVPKIRAFCPWSVDSAGQLPEAPHVAQAARPAPRPSARPEIVAIGTSTGGPNALAEVLPRLPADFPAPIVIVQHMPPVFTRHLAQRLNAQCRIEVAEAAAGDVLRPGKAWIAPGDHHMALERQGTKIAIKLHQGPPENSCRPAVDVLFRTVAELYAARSLAVVLTGMGNDGLRGCERIREQGGRIVVQDEATSVVWGMPGAVARANFADSILPLDQIFRAIERAVTAKDVASHDRVSRPLIAGANPR